MYLLIEFPGQKKRLFVHDKKTLKKSALSLCIFPNIFIELNMNRITIINLGNLFSEIISNDWSVQCSVHIPFQCAV